MLNRRYMSFCKEIRLKFHMENSGNFLMDGYVLLTMHNDMFSNFLSHRDITLIQACLQLILHSKCKLLLWYSPRLVYLDQQKQLHLSRIQRRPKMIIIPGNCIQYTRKYSEKREVKFIPFPHFPFKPSSNTQRDRGKNLVVRAFVGG